MSLPQVTQSPRYWRARSVKWIFYSFGQFSSATMKMTVWTRLSSSWGWMMEGLQRGWCLIMLHHHLRQKVKQIVEGPHHSYYLTLLCLFGWKIYFPPKWKFLVLCKIFKTFKNKNKVFVKTWNPDLLLKTSSSKNFVCYFYQICFERPTVLIFF